MPGKKRTKSASDWDSVEGWNAVDVGDDFLLGSEEFGFAGLEELDGSAFDIETLQNAQPQHTDNTTATATDKKKKTKKQQSTESIEELQARIKALQQENKQLKKKQKKRKTDDNTTNNDTNNNKDINDDKDAPRVDVSAWHDYHLSPAILDAISIIGFTAPTHVQAECLPAAIRDGRDVIGAAQTGSGKTLAFGLPILQRLSHQRDIDPERPRHLRALILAPTRELAMQVSDHISTIARRLDIWVVPIVGGISAAKQERLLAKKPEIVVATPGRLWDMMKDTQEHVSNLRWLEFLVIDEADRMVQQGHFGELSNILTALRQQKSPVIDDDAVEGDAAAAATTTTTKEVNGKNDDNNKKNNNTKSKSKKQQQSNQNQYDTSMQTFVFSATLTLPTEMRKRLRKGGGGSSGSASLESLMDIVPFSIGKKPKIVDLTSDRKLADNVTEACISCTEKERDDHLYCLLASHPGRTIVFVNAISSVRRLAAILKILGLPVHPLHAGMQQRARLKALDRFKSDENAILIASDVAARGLDIKDVKCVVHYQLPASVDVYVHRSGRTARADNEGIAIAFVTPKEEGRFAALLKALGRDMPPEFPVDVSVMPEVRERVRLAVEIDASTRTVTKRKAEKSWRKQQAEQLDLILSDDDEDDDEDDGGVKGRRLGKKGRKERDGDGGDKDVSGLQAQLSRMLAEPLQPKFSRKYFTGGAVAGITLQQQQQQEQKKNKKVTKKSGKNSNSDTHGDDDREMDGRMVHKAVEFIEKVTNIRKNSKKTAEKNTTTTNKGKKKSVKETRAAVLAAAVKKQLEKKANKGKRKAGGLVVVPQVFGRESQGPDALQALRSRLSRGD